MERTFDIGHPVIYVDEYGRQQPALITAIHGEEYVLKEDETYGSMKKGDMHYPCVNLVFTSQDTEKTDPYGRQIERVTSVGHKEQSSAHGFYFMWPDEEPNPAGNTRK